MWFPGYGWQNFDPTAVVPASNPSPGSTALNDVGWRPAARPAGSRSWSSSPAPACVVLAVRRRRARPATWAARVARDTERAGRRAGRPRRPAETLVEYAATLDELSGSGSTWGRLASSVEASAYGGREPPPEAQRAMVAEARSTRVAAGRSVPARASGHGG